MVVIEYPLFADIPFELVGKIAGACFWTETLTRSVSKAEDTAQRRALGRGDQTYSNIESG